MGNNTVFKMLLSIALITIFFTGCDSNKRVMEAISDQQNTQQFAYLGEKEGVRPTPKMPMSKQSVINYVYAWSKASNSNVTLEDVKTFVSKYHLTDNSAADLIAEILNTAFAEYNINFIASVSEGQIVIKHNIVPMVNGGSTISGTQDGLDGPFIPSNSTDQGTTQ